MSSDMDFCHSWEIYLTNTEKRLLDTATGQDAVKTASKKTSS